VEEHPQIEQASREEETVGERFAKQVVAVDREK
jgi:hypothetical protein